MKKGTIWMALGVLLIIGALSLTVYNIQDEKRAKQESLDVVEHLSEEIIKNTEEKVELEDVPLYVDHPDMEMPTISIDKNRYIGILEIPALGLELPIMSNWNYSNLKVSPCRYDGSVYSKDLIIAGHNYNGHLGLVNSLIPGDIVLFTDADGNQFEYEVFETEILDGTSVEEMKDGEWDMTLFTCTYSGQARVTVRLVQI